MKKSPPEVAGAAARIKLIALDVDGVLTDGRISYTSSGEEIKSFNVRDGHAIKMAFRAGIQVAVITGRESSIVERRCEELGIEILFQGAKRKSASLQKILLSTGLDRSEIAFMGDDVVDLPVMMSVGLSACPSDAAREVRQRSDMVMEAAGGRGAVREFIFLILQSQGLLEDLMRRYLT